MTGRQREIARALALGDSVRQIACRLGIRRQSVRRQLSALYEVTGVLSQAQLVGWCVVHGVVSMEELRQVYAEKPYGQVG